MYSSPDNEVSRYAEEEGMIVPTGRAGRLVNSPPPVICEHPSPHKHTHSTFLLFCLPTLGRMTWPHQWKEPGHHLVGPGANGATQLAAVTFSGLIGNSAVTLLSAAYV